jgi:hypothetical protein
MSDIEARLADPEFLAVIDDMVQTVMEQRVSEGHVPAEGPAFDDERSALTVQMLTVLLGA